QPRGVRPRASWSPNPARPAPGEPVLGDVSPERPPAQPMAVAVPGPVDEEGLALDLVPLHEAPVARVLRVIAVVAHDEVRLGRDDERLARVGIAAEGRDRRVPERRGVL